MMVGAIVVHRLRPLHPKESTVAGARWRYGHGVRAGGGWEVIHLELVCLKCGASIVDPEQIGIAVGPSGPEVICPSCGQLVAFGRSWPYSEALRLAKAEIEAAERKAWWRRHV
jgi:hypothetical protein